MSQAKDERQPTRARIEEITDEELGRVQELLRRIGGPHVQWGAVDSLNVWIAENRMEADRQAARRILIATWVLALATLGLVAATAGLIVVTIGE
jgi:hypothetical protein